jgi:ribosomal protein L31
MSNSDSLRIVGARRWWDGWHRGTNPRRHRSRWLIGILVESNGILQNSDAPYPGQVSASPDKHPSCIPVAPFPHGKQKTVGCNCNLFELLYHRQRHQYQRSSGEQFQCATGGLTIPTTGTYTTQRWKVALQSRSHAVYPGVTALVQTGKARHPRTPGVTQTTNPEYLDRVKNLPVSRPSFPSHRRALINPLIGSIYDESPHASRSDRRHGMTRLELPVNGDGHIHISLPYPACVRTPYAVLQR